MFYLNKRLLDGENCVKIGYGVMKRAGVLYLLMKGISRSPFVCAFCGLETPHPVRRETIGMYEIIGCPPCGAVAFCQADDAQNWPSAEGILCREMLLLEP